ncbi:P-loop containing nucleoside triphosphate hydrolase protein [Vararia minispora EC-137]|uniref:P-loop containing nucleoside triphosphate hydrolase protein n=1 Tax=Vararia minispora EC-137 TaxID=1314806 RepID=A0ACB8QUK9_9AGAM|nr:P-loop containing nucleoside triphosphate hydrolase protein [Vararia minispora EC-137]
MSVLELVLEHIHSNLSWQQARPLFVAFQGPQGSGKTYVTEHAASALRRESLRVATLSIDDLYLSHDGLVALADAHPKNGLLHGRGQPGTHDIPLGARVLRALKRINETLEAVRLPAFDKSQFSGEGDRVLEDHWTIIQPPVDVVILEGWCVGFYPQARDEIARKISESPKGLESTFDMNKYVLEDVLKVNELLAQYVDWWDLVDVFVQIKPEDSSPYVHIYEWRLQQEHWMKSQNGGKGMTDAQVKAFVDRYIPGYHFFGDGILHGGLDPHTGRLLTPPWTCKSDGEASSKFLRVTIGGNRQVLHVDKI